MGEEEEGAGGAGEVELLKVGPEPVDVDPGPRRHDMPGQPRPREDHPPEREAAKRPAACVLSLLTHSRWCVDTTKTTTINLFTYTVKKGFCRGLKTFSFQNIHKTRIASFKF